MRAFLLEWRMVGKTGMSMAERKALMMAATKDYYSDKQMVVGTVE